MRIELVEWREIGRGRNQGSIGNVKLPAHTAGLPGKEISFLIVPLDPAYKAGLAGHLPAKW